MISIRIDTKLLQEHQQNILHSIVMMQTLRAAGVPVIGKIIFNGPERGTLVQWQESDIDGDEWVLQWWDNHETRCIGQRIDDWLLVKSGRGVGFSWTHYRHPDDPEPVVDEDW